MAERSPEKIPAFCGRGPVETKNLEERSKKTEERKRKDMRWVPREVTHAPWSLRRAYGKKSLKRRSGRKP